MKDQEHSSSERTAEWAMKQLKSVTTMSKMSYLVETNKKMRMKFTYFTHYLES